MPSASTLSPPGAGRAARSGPPRIAIVGSGFAGIGMAIRLLKTGITSFTLFEAASGIGGTWRDNTYPGAACDIPSHLYSFSFEPNPDWSRIFSPQREILDYLRRCARKYDVERHIRFNTAVRVARFDEARQVWQLTLVTRGDDCGNPRHTGHANDARDDSNEHATPDETIEHIEHVEADIVISASGPLSRPALPEIPGLDRFAGTLFHSARWDHAYPLAGKRVAVIGTGASAIQFVPQIQPQVAQLTLFQRTPPWVMPRPDHAVSERARQLYRKLPFTQRFVRNATYWQLESRAIAFVLQPKLLSIPTRFGLSYLQRRVPDPALRSKLTPHYRFGCKRILLSSDYYPAVTKPNVDVVTTPIREITTDGIVTADGTHHAVDAIICGTGFQVNDVPAPFAVTGAGGADLSERWLRDGPEAYLGVSIADFPNFFMIVGPNTGLGHNSMIYMIESQIQYIADCLRVLERSGARSMDLRADVQRAFNARLQARLAQTVWASGCRSWYQTKAGKITTLWPGFTFSFRRRTRRMRPGDYRFAS